MTPDDLRNARTRLGKRWVDRPLLQGELGAILRLAGADPAESIRNMERGHSRISGAIGLAVELMLDGARPRDLETILGCLVCP